MVYCRLLGYQLLRFSVRKYTPIIVMRSTRNSSLVIWFWLSSFETLCPRSGWTNTRIEKRDRSPVCFPQLRTQYQNFVSLYFSYFLGIFRPYGPINDYKTTTQKITTTFCRVAALVWPVAYCFTYSSRTATYHCKNRKFS